MKCPTEKLVINICLGRRAIPDCEPRLIQSRSWAREIGICGTQKNIDTSTVSKVGSSGRVTSPCKNNFSGKMQNADKAEPTEHSTTEWLGFWLGIFVIVQL